MAERKEAHVSRGRSAVQETAAAVRSSAAETGEVLGRESSNLGTAALIGAGVAIIQPELIPGMLIGVGATMIPKLLPSVGPILRPVTKAIVKAGYGVTAGIREMVADVSEQFEDVVAEVRAERGEARTTGESARRKAPQTA